MEFKRDKFLPIGTVVMLENGTKRVMITGFCVRKQEKSDDKDVWDYCGCMYPEGIIKSNQTCVFNHDQIKEIYHFGLEDDEEKIFKARLKEFLKTY